MPRHPVSAHVVLDFFLESGEIKTFEMLSLSCFFFLAVSQQLANRRHRRIYSSIIRHIVSLCSSIVLFSMFLLLHALVICQGFRVFSHFPPSFEKESPKHVNSISLTENARTINEISSAIDYFRKRNETVRSVAVWNPRVGMVQ